MKKVYVVERVVWHFNEHRVHIGIFESIEGAKRCLLGLGYETFTEKRPLYWTTETKDGPYQHYAYIKAEALLD